MDMIFGNLFVHQRARKISCWMICSLNEITDDSKHLKKLSGERMLLFDEELMQFAMGNCITLEDTNGNRKLLKKRYEQKIDAVAAMMDAYIAFKHNREAFE